MEESLEREGKAYQVHYVKELVKEYTRSLLVEAKWLKEGYMPTLKEYMSNSLMSSAYTLMIAKYYVGWGDIVTEDVFIWVASHPAHVNATCLILRLVDDIATHEETGASEKEAYKCFSKQVEEAWKVINQESLRPTHVPFLLSVP